MPVSGVFGGGCESGQGTRYMTLETMAPLSDNPIVMLSAVPGA